jgi:hypothetical protein
LATGCFTFNGADVPPKYYVCIYGMLSGDGTVGEGLGFDVSNEILELCSPYMYLNLASKNGARVVSFSVFRFVRFYGAYGQDGVILSFGRVWR